MDTPEAAQRVPAKIAYFDEALVFFIFGGNAPTNLSAILSHSFRLFSSQAFFLTYINPPSGLPLISIGEAPGF